MFLKQDGKLLSCREKFTMFVIQVMGTLIKSQTKKVGMGSKSQDLYGVVLMILRILSFDTGRKGEV